MSKWLPRRRSVLASCAVAETSGVEKLVPTAALSSLLDQRIVYTVDAEGEVAVTPVETGGTHGRMTVIRKGLEAGALAQLEALDLAGRRLRQLARAMPVEPAREPLAPEQRARQLQRRGDDQALDGPLELAVAVADPRDQPGERPG